MSYIDPTYPEPSLSNITFRGIFVFMSNPESVSDNNRHIIDVPKYPRAYTMPAAAHEAVDSIVDAANHRGAKTSKSEMIAVLVHHALTSMSDEELTAAWLTYRHSDEESLRTRPPFSSE